MTICCDTCRRPVDDAGHITRRHTLGSRQPGRVVSALCSSCAAPPEHCRRCGIVITMSGHPRYCAVCDDVLCGGHRVMA